MTVQQNVCAKVGLRVIQSVIFVQRLVTPRSAGQAVGQYSVSKAHHCAITNDQTTHLANRIHNCFFSLLTTNFVRLCALLF